jgi:hypothetical protein
MDRDISDYERELDSAELDERSFLQKATDGYFYPKSFERSGKLYESLGVRTFKKYCPTGEVWNKCLNYRDVKGNSTEDLRNYEKQTRIFEGIHVVGGIAFFALFGLNPIGLLTNALINFYPVITQRYNRSRIQNIVEKREAREMPAPYK